MSAFANWKKKIKVNGKEQTIGLSEAFRYLQKELAADEKMKHSSQTEKAHKQLIEALRSNPIPVLEQMGYDVDELAKQRIHQRLQFESMSEDQRRAYQAQQEAEQWKQRLLAEHKQRAEHQEAQLKTASLQKWQTGVIHSLQNAGLPPDPLTAKLALQVVLSNREAGYNDFSVDDAIPYVKDFCLQMAKYYYKAVPTADLLKALGSEFDQGLRKFYLEKAQNPIQEKFKDRPVGNFKKEKSDDPRGKTMSPDEYRDHLRKTIG